MVNANFRNDGKIGWETLFVTGLLILVFVPWLGENLFTTKGEPREAIVAVSMLQQGNWILPVSFGNDIPYKPPMLAWVIAALGWLNGGVVTEFLSRLPSAVALIVMSVAGFRFFAHRTSVNIAVAMTFITATSLEVFRSATICRVDMLLTMFVVTALYELYRQSESKLEGTWLPCIPAVVLMTGGVLTKGPVGMILPCMVMFVFRLMRGNGFWKTTVSLGLSGVLSLLLPCLWYVAAYRQGGEEFFRLAMEENFGRMTGTMSYASHENPVWYNFLTMIWGIAPYTLLLLISLFVVPWKRLRFPAPGWWSRLRRKDPVELFSMLSAILIFVFYCFPKSKRSVYLLPVYPFVGYFIAIYVGWLLKNKKLWCVKAYGWIICVVGMIAGVAVALVVAMKFEAGEPMATMLGCMKVAACRFFPALMWFAVIVAGMAFCRVLLKRKPKNVFSWVLLYTMCVYAMVQAVFLPAIMNVKSEKTFVDDIELVIGRMQPVYSYMPDRLSRFYTVNYYMDDRVRLFFSELPDEGYVIVNEGDVDGFKELALEDYKLREVRVFGKKGGKQRHRIHMIEFQRR